MNIYTFSKAKLLIFSALLILSPLFLSKNVIHAQQPSTESDQISSDLSLDLNLAQQNPAPDQQQIVQSETKQAEVVTNTGETTVVIPQDKIAPEVKTESKQEAVIPEQTTSEQVITKPEEVEINKNGTPVPTQPDQNQGPVNSNSSGDQPTDQPTGIQSPRSDTNNGSVNQQVQVTVTGTPQDSGVPNPTGNLVPGTTVTEPNDNAAPVDNSTNPNLPAPTQPSDSPSNDTPVQQNTNSQQSQPQTPPTTTDNGGTSQQSTPATNDSSGAHSSDNSNSTPDTVQGVAIGPNPFTMLMQKMLKIFRGSNK